MVKLSGKSFRRFNLIVSFPFWLSAFWAMPGCANQPQRPGSEVSHLSNFPISQHPVAAKKLWTKKTPGLLTDLNIARDGSAILVATVPDRDSVEAGANRSRNFAALYSKDGSLFFKLEMPAQIKSQTLADDGSLAIIATYDDTIRAYDRKGKQVWSREAICKPVALSEIHKILCFHDDDAEPDLAFEILNWDGSKVASYPVKQDSLMVKVAQNQKFFVVGLTHGKILVFDTSFKPIWKSSVNGELTDLAISSPKSGFPQVAALYNLRKSHAGKHQGKRKKKGKKAPQGEVTEEQKIALFSPKSGVKGAKGAKRKKETEISPRSRLDQIEMSPDGDALFGYGNDSDGQIIARIAEHSGDWEWKRGDSRPAEYSSQMAAVQDWIWAGFEDLNATTRHSHVLGFDWDGGLKTDIVVPSEEGAYLYAYAFAQQTKLLAIGSDDGELSLFEVK
jgi:hypothetical protein